jgi:hypothetical protein
MGMVAITPWFVGAALWEKHLDAEQVADLVGALSATLVIWTLAALLGLLGGTVSRSWFSAVAGAVLFAALHAAARAMTLTGTSDQAMQLILNTRHFTASDWAPIVPMVLMIAACWIVAVWRVRRV